MRLSYKELLFYWGFIEKVQDGGVSNVTKTDKEEVISFDGSSTIKEWWGNLKALFPIGGFHKNFSKTANGFFTLLVGNFKREDNITVVGTSRGGAIAIIYAFILKVLRYNVRCITFVQPKVATKKGYKKLKDSGLEVHRVIIANDIVDNLPPFFEHYQTEKYKLDGVKGKLNHTAIREALERKIKEK